MREDDDNIAEAVHGFDLLYRLPRDIQVFVVLPTDQTMSRAIAEPIMTAVRGKEDETI